MEQDRFPTAAAYIRVSTEDQIEFSPDSQLKRIQEYADSRHIRLPDHLVYVDEGISGRSAENRPAFLSMIRAARQKPRPFDQILVWKFSRFARNRQDSIFYKSMLRKECGIDVISVTEQLSGDPTSILIEALLEAMDEYYSINLAQEVRRGMNEKFSRGGVVSIPPFGYSMGADRYEIDPDKAPALQLIFMEFLNGKNFRQIADELNERGEKTLRGNPFQPRTVRYILENPVYTGCQRRHLEENSTLSIVRGRHDPLISEEAFLAVQERLCALEQRHIPKGRSAPADFMLRGLVRCSHCGSTLTLAQKGNSLQCCRYARGQCPESHSISLKKLNQAVLAQIARDIPLSMELRDLTSRKKGAEKDRGNSPVPTSILSFKGLLSILAGPDLPESFKNELLRSFILEIKFYRKEGQIKICYHL